MDIPDEALHINGLFEMLSHSNPCYHCPREQHGFNIKHCKTCLEFIGLSKKELVCPCSVLEPHEALKRTYLKLEELGVI